MTKGVLKKCNGSVWSNSLAKKCNGSTWTDGKVRHCDGANWYDNYPMHNHTLSNLLLLGHKVITVQVLN